MHVELAPWTFAVTPRGGVDTARLFRAVDAIVSPCGVEQTAPGTWRPVAGADEAMAQSAALIRLSKQPSAMAEIASVPFSEDDGETEEWLDIVKRRNPDRLNAK